MRIVQLSDLHFGTETPAVLEALLAACAQIEPVLVLLSGDLTQRARRHEFDACRQLIQQLAPAQVLAVPGNHDLPLFNVWHRFRAPYAGFRRVFGWQLEPVFETPELLVVGVNTTDPRRHVDGHFDTHSVEQVAGKLQSSSAKLKLVVGHHPVDAVLASDEQNIAGGARAAMQRWCEAGMQLYLAGHIHYPFFAPLSRRYPDLPDQAWTVQAGTAISTRTRDGKPNSFNLIDADLEMRVLSLTRWDFNAESGRFDPAEQVQLPLGV
ncbi:metallophosphoesterase family protein [Marinobacterium stanieri]|uniref:3',5'-cyclic AMP phosphodiesterase CpdA n=1 Tax=Marinobacterium stanieri TaxID=49186 RepID=A0A1N6U284_9GAMM|nr:metallophosphoesterase [Marinobacterium stanieri]SIQ59714.1 3',5'-cyclic AMP phosphodiesterase CpdA [Marinobacterium stanieri]